jgi:vitamin-K-epoxide reductase (warfarin-sensitive)
MKRYLMPILISVLALVGVVVSALALQVHYSTAVQACSINEKWDCGIVNHSPFAEIKHIPVAVVGIVGYLFLIGLALARQRALLFLSTVVGLGFALWLTFIEEYVLMVWCLYCVISQVAIGLITFLSLGWLAAEYIALKRANRAA